MPSINRGSSRFAIVTDRNSKRVSILQGVFVAASVGAVEHHRGHKTIVSRNLKKVTYTYRLTVLAFSFQLRVNKLKYLNPRGCSYREKNILELVGEAAFSEIIHDTHWCFYLNIRKFTGLKSCLLFNLGGC